MNKNRLQKQPERNTGHFPVRHMNLKTLKKPLITGLCIGLAAALITRNDQGLIEFASNLFFFSGISLFIAALCQLVTHLGFFDNIRYSFKRTKEVLSTKNFKRENSELGDRWEYARTHHKGSFRGELFLSAGIMLVCSLILAFLA